MMRSMFSGVSGLKVHQTKMDVIGNNIANVNTTGFKSSRVTFNEIFNQTLAGASKDNPITGRGGVNPMQVGLGVNVATIDTLMTEGAAQRTDNPLDLKIEGEGFLMVKNGNNSDTMYTRAGNLYLDASGNLVAPGGGKIMGWKPDLVTNKINTSGPVEPLNILGGASNIAPSATSSIIVDGNFDMSTLGGDAVSIQSILEKEFKIDTASGDTLTFDTGKEPLILDNNQIIHIQMTVYDSLGNPYQLDLPFYKSATNEWKVIEREKDTLEINVSKGGGTETKIKDLQEVKPKLIDIKTGTDLYGNMKAGVQPSITSILGNGNEDLTQLTLNFTTDGKVSSASDFSFEVVGFPYGSSDMKENPSDNKMAPLKVNFKNVTQYSTATNAKVSSANGYPSGSLSKFTIGSDGTIIGIYSNGEKQNLGQIALATFQNPAGLEKSGGNLFRTSANSGQVSILQPGSGGAGIFNSGVLEMSNVDLSREFTEMITTQRGFQANSRIISTSDEMLQELVNLKR